MNIGIDFNVKNTKAAVLSNGFGVEDYKIFDIKNVLVFTEGGIFTGEDGFNKFLTENNSTLYELDQIIGWNGLIINKKQISAEKCLSVILSQLLNNIKIYTQDNEINFICVSIPYDKYYYWYGLVTKALCLIGMQKIRIISQPAAFFSKSKIDYLHGTLCRTGSRNELDEYLFIAVSQDNTNVSSVEHSSGVLEIITSHYINTVAEREVKESVLNYFLSEIRKDQRNFVLKNQKTIAIISEAVNEFLITSYSEKNFELNLPYILCEDGEYRTLNMKIDLDDLRSFLAPTIISLAEAIKQLADKNQWLVQGHVYNIILICDLFIQQDIESVLSKIFNRTRIIPGGDKSLAIGAFNFSKIMTGEIKDFLPLEVIPFSVFVRLRAGEFIEVISKDRTIPTTSKEYSFEIKDESKSKFVEIHLTTKEGDVFQSLDIWKIEVPNTRFFKIAVDVDAHMKISLYAYSESGQKLSVQKGSTFSFSGAGFGVGIKGKDIRQYILNQFNYLNAVLDNKEIAIFEPDENFYSMLKGGDPFKALRYLGHFLKLKSLPDVELVDSKFFEEQGIGGFITGSKISIPKYFIKDPYGFGYVLAHELAHYILIHEEQIILDDEQENEILTEIFVIYSGMGKLFLNGFKSKDVEGSSLHARGYLDEKIIQHIHKIYFAKFNINITEYKKNLTIDGVRMLEAS